MSETTKHWEEEAMAESATRNKRELLTDAYAAALLANPPVRGLQESEKGRERLARVLAEKDVERFARALSACGMRIVGREG